MRNRNQKPNEVLIRLCFNSYRAHTKSLRSVPTGTVPPLRSRQPLQLEVKRKLHKFLRQAATDYGKFGPCARNFR